MYEETKVIDGVLHIKSSPDGLYREMTAQHITRYYLEVSKDLQDAYGEIQEINETMGRME